MIVILAVHPRIRSMVLSDSARTELALRVDLREAAPELWTSGYSAVSEAEVLVTGWGTPPIDDDALDKLPNLKAIMHIGGSVRELLPADVWSQGIQVVTAADANNERVADYVAAMPLLACKGSFRAAETMRERGRLPGPTAGPGVVGQTLGLVSFGSIARKVARRAHAWKMNVVAWDPYVDDEDMVAEGVRPVRTLREAFATSAVVSVHAPLIPGETEGLVGLDELRALPMGATLINTARGALLDEDALSQVLGIRPDLYAILDVTWPEPPAADSALYTLPNVLLTGHSAGSTGTEARAMGDLIAHEVVEFAAGRPSIHRVQQDASTVRA